jgi:DNA (cytosine-5)-methyltransferase 1
MTAYYNEIDPYAAQWLRNLIDAGHIAPGIVDERSIEDVFPSDLRGFTQCHFFAGIGVWSHALRSAGWSDDRPVWTGSCPCQPFSDAGKGAGLADERHLWPAWFHLIRECRPVRVYGEQVASRDALGWWDVVHADLEDARYACGAFDLCAAGVGAPHIRQRLYWLADDHGQRQPQRPQRDGRALEPGQQASRGHDARGCGLLGDAGDAGDEGLAQRLGFPEIPGGPSGADEGQAALGAGVHVGELADAGRERGKPDGLDVGEATSSRGGEAREQRIRADAGAVNVARFWDDCAWIDCRDGKRRPTQPGLQPLAHGAPSRVGRLRAYGNAIVAPLATELVRATA